jgi:argininosuccinate lyase
MQEQAMALWGGRFSGKSDPLFRAFNDSLRFDRRLVRQDIRGSMAWARAIAAAGVINDTELTRLTRALEALDREVQNGTASIEQSDHEDVHSWVEAELIARVGDLGKKLHTGRSRNDQVATDLRLWTAESIGHIRAAITAAQRSLVGLAGRELGVVVPGYTHLQRGQPILFSHWCLAYVEMLARDDQRLQDCDRRVRILPLGSGALAGTAYPIDRAALCRELGFLEPSGNSLDAVGDRDFVFETLACLTCTALHLSRLAEDLILYCSSEFGFVTLDDSVSSGSSLMPQKKNPDSLELTRAKAARVLGALVTLAGVIKGLPLAYNKDLQEDKEPLFDAVEHTMMCLRMLPPVLDSLRVNRDTCHRAALGDGTILATELADYLVSRGVPFREAHDVAGRAVRAALEAGVGLHELGPERLRAIDPRIGPDVTGVLTLEAALAKRDVLGGTSPAQVALQLDAWRRKLASQD